MITEILGLVGDDMVKSKSKSLIYDCYACFIVDHFHKIYPVRSPKNHLESIFSLKVGDIVHIKGLGSLRFVRRHVENYDYREKGKDGLYQEISLSFITVQ